MVTGVDFVSVGTTDFESTRAFYRDVLALTPSKEWGPVPHGAEFETGTVTIAVLNSESLGMDFQPGGGFIALQVDDVAATKAELESRGVQFKGDIIDSGVCHQAFFEDPSGNTLGLHHRYAPPNTGPGS